MRLVVPGGSGFIGRNLLRNAPKSWDILAIYNKSTDFPAFVNQLGLSNVRTARCDLADHKETALIAKENGQFDACVFLAANGDPTYSIADPVADLKSTTLTFLNFIKLFRVKRLVYLSSGAVYDGLKGPVSPTGELKPSLPYSISHLACENYLRILSKMGQPAEYVVLRFFGAFGPYEPHRKIYTRMINAFYFENKDVFEVRGDGENFIDAMYVDDAVRGLLKTVVGSVKNTTIDFCSGRRLTINQLVGKAARIFGKENVEIIHEGKTVEHIEFWASPDEMEKCFHFKPKISLEEGFSRLVKFLEGEKMRDA